VAANLNLSLADRAEMMIPPMLWDGPRRRDAAGDKVVLLHGLWRSFHAMEPLARRLTAEGYSTLNLPYPSSRKSFDDILPKIRDQIAEFAEGQRVHIVGHSLGGIIARFLTAGNPPWQPGRLVMLASPNGGSEIIDWLSQKPLVKPLLSPAARALATEILAKNLPGLPPEQEVIVIMGSRVSIPFFRNILRPENDGIVSAERGRTAGLRGFSVVDADHTFIQIHPETIRRTLRFLKNGSVE
jgi:pimeloyl-ACP methyl ester carboxylesterase